MKTTIKDPESTTVHPDLNKMPLHEALRYLRKRYVGTQKQMAKALGLSVKSNHIAQVESGDTNLSADKLDLWLALCFHKNSLERMSPAETREKILSFNKKGKKK